jgi:hypothetical protein
LTKSHPEAHVIGAQSLDKFTTIKLPSYFHFQHSLFCQPYDRVPQICRTHNTSSMVETLITVVQMLNREELAVPYVLDGPTART